MGISEYKDASVKIKEREREEAAAHLRRTHGSLDEWLCARTKGDPGDGKYKYFFHSGFPHVNIDGKMVISS